MITTEEIKGAWRYADMAYLPSKTLLSMFGDSITVIDPKLSGFGDACYVIKDEARAVIMFPGSNDVVDWIKNLDFHESNGLHDGFLDGIEDLADDLLKVLGEIKCTKLLITGHSRGGALADMFMERYIHRLSDIGADCNVDIDCITFAQPRIATKEFYEIPCAKQLPNVRYLRVHTETDPVPDRPPEKFGFVHYGDYLVIGEKLTKWQRLKLWWSRIRNGDMTPLITGGHLASTYRNEIERLR